MKIMKVFKNVMRAGNGKSLLSHKGLIMAHDFVCQALWYRTLKKKNKTKQKQNLTPP